MFDTFHMPASPFHVSLVRTAHDDELGLRGGSCGTSGQNKWELAARSGIAFFLSFRGFPLAEGQYLDDRKEYLATDSTREY